MDKNELGRCFGNIECDRVRWNGRTLRAMRHVALSKKASFASEDSQRIVLPARKGESARRNQLEDFIKATLDTPPNGFVKCRHFIEVGDDGTNRTPLEIMVKAYEGALLLADICLLIVKMLFWTLEGMYRLIVPHEEKNVAGEIVLITGAGHGIGRELALKYASLGATVVCLDLNPQGNQETINEIKKIGATAVHAYQCDVANREQVMKVAQKVKEEVGDVTILLNNAGIMPCHSFLETTTDEIKRIFDINVLAHFWLLQAFLPTMIEKNHGHVVALSSIAGVVGIANLVPYCSSKFAVRGLMEAMHEELRQLHPTRTSNVKFTTIYPYMVDTGLCKNARIRFPSLMAMVSPKEAAAHIISAQRRNVTESSIPSYWLTINNTLRNFPDKVSMQLVDFLNSGVDSDLKTT